MLRLFVTSGFITSSKAETPSKNRINLSFKLAWIGAASAGSCASLDGGVVLPQRSKAR
jgi:hypothetical protein